jgi:predicted aspartyl protease
MPYDADMDFGANRLNLFLPGSCPETKIYWPTAPLTVVPFQFANSHITIKVRLDGRAVYAVIDTGAPFTTLNLRAAERLFDLAPEDMNLNARAGQDGAPVNIYTHRFSLMTFEGVTVSNPLMLVVPIHLGVDDMPFRWKSRGVSAPDLIIGMDILRTLHLYIAYRDKTLYITRADGDAAARLLPPPADASRAEADPAL